jgi:hypothetical protein
VGTEKVIRFLLFAAFGMESPRSKISQELLARIRAFTQSCKSTVNMVSVRSYTQLHPLNSTESSVIVPVKVVLFDVIHAVLQDLILQGTGCKGRGAWRETSGVIILCEALLSLVVKVAIPTLSTTASSTSSTTSMYKAYYKSIIRRSIISIDIDINDESSKTDGDHYHELSKRDYIGNIHNDSGKTDSGESNVFTFFSVTPNVLNWLVESISAIGGDGGIGLISEGGGRIGSVSCWDGIGVEPSRIGRGIENSTVELPSFLTPCNNSDSDNSSYERDTIDYSGKEGQKIYPSIEFTKNFFRLLSFYKGAAGEVDMRSIAHNSNTNKNNHVDSWRQYVANSFVICSGGDLSSLSLLPPPLRSFVILALHQSKEHPFHSTDYTFDKFSQKNQHEHHREDRSISGTDRTSPNVDFTSTPPLEAWPPSILIMIGRNDLCAHISPSSSSTGMNKRNGGRGFGEVVLKFDYSYLVIFVIYCLDLLVIF